MKINVLVISSDSGGVGYYRINSPYLSLNDPDINISFVTSINPLLRFDESTLKDINVIIYNKNIPFRYDEDFLKFNDIIEKYDIKLIYDIDDYWYLHSSHIKYKKWNNSKSPERVIELLKKADYVTTTTPVFAKEISEHNPNVEVIENAINTKEQQWIPNKIESDKVRFMWGGGITHEYDLALMKDSIKVLDKDFIKKTQLYMCGFDLRVKTKKGIYFGDINKNPWGNFESIFTNNYKWVKNNKYLNYLKDNKFNDVSTYGYKDEFKDEFYQRRWTKPIFVYGSMYNESDVSLAPLKNNSTFNNVKSQLKVIEAGCYKNPIIASNTAPYQIDIIDGKNGFLIDDSDKNGWYNKMKWLSDNPNAIEDMGNNLHELVMEKYTLDKINKKRVDLIKKISK